MGDDKNQGTSSDSDENTLIFEGGEKQKGVRPPYLVIVDGPHKGARFPLQEGKNVIGRLDECRVTLEDQSVSRKHAELNLLGEGWTLQDLQSKNGSYVNSALTAEPVVIGHKDLLRFGIYTLRFVSEVIDEKEEMEGADVGEWGTVVTGEKKVDKTGDTARMSVSAEGGETDDAKLHETTDPHDPLIEGEEDQSPLEELGEDEEYEEIEEIVEEPNEEGERRWLPKARPWLLLGFLFAALLGGGLYAYWQFILAPQEAAKEEEAQRELLAEKKKKAREERIKSIPLGPPEPEKPATVPVFLDCIANPLPAVISFKGNEIGKTPVKANIELEPDKTYEIIAKFEMPEIQETYTETLSFKVNPEESMIPILFRAPVGTIKVVSLPRDASFYLEAFFDYDKFKGKPIKLTNLILNKPIYAPYGRYVLELRQPREGAGDGQVVEDIVYRREFKLQQENPSFVMDVDEDSLKEFPAEIRSIPRGAEVYVDNRRVGETPYFGTLTVGKHTLTLRKEGFFEHTGDFEARVNMPFKTEVTLRTSLAGEKLNEAKEKMRHALYQDAIQSLSEVFAKEPTEGEKAEARYMLGNVYIRLQDLSKAKSYFEQSEQHPDFKYWSKLGIVSVLAAEGKTTEALLPLVEVFLNAKEEEIVKEAKSIFHEISPLRSIVYIQSEPAGAAVYLNDEKIEQATPVLLHEVGLGSYRVRLEKAGYQTVHLTLNLSVNEFNPVLAKLKPLPE